MALDHTVYRPRNAEASVLHVVIRQHLADFLRAAANLADGAAGVPRVPDLRRAGRRMTERAALLVDAVLPAVPVRQWVLTLPYRLRYLLDVLRCPRCAGRMELSATIDDPAVIHRILAHLGLAGARDGPEPAAAVSRPRDDEPTLPFALPS